MPPVHTPLKKAPVVVGVTDAAKDGTGKGVVIPAFTTPRLEMSVVQFVESLLSVPPVLK
jgi:hypothetical protein